MTSRSTLLKLLTEACELEHGLACSYLYSAMTLKSRPDARLPAEQAPMVRQWASQLYFIASQEMLHLAQAWNLLSALGGTPYYLRPNFPQNTKYYPLHLKLALEPYGEAALDRDAHLRAHQPRHLDGLLHHRGHQRLGALVSADPGHRRPGQRAERVEGDVSHQLDPDVVTQVLLDRALETAGDHRGGELGAPGRDRAVRLADGEPSALQMPHHAGRLDHGRGIHHAAHRPVQRQHLGHRPARVHTLDPASLVRAGEPVEVPPRNAVLRSDDRGVRPQQRLHQVARRRVCVRLEAQEHVVHRADLLGPVGRVRMGGEITAWTEHLHPLVTQRREVRATGHQMDLDTGTAEARPDIGADRARPEHSNSHGELPS